MIVHYPCEKGSKKLARIVAQVVASERANRSIVHMAQMSLPHNEKAREDWRRVTSHIHQEEQKLKELQLDHNEKVAVVEALKAELRQIKHEAHECEVKESKLVQAAATAFRKRQDLELQWKALQEDRALLMSQLAGEQDGLKADQAKIEEATKLFSKELQDQQAYKQHLCKLIGVQQESEDDTRHVDDKASDDMGAGVGTPVLGAAAGPAVREAVHA